MKQIVAIDLHDFSPVNHNIEYLEDLRSHYPNLKITLFMAPFDQQSGKMESVLKHLKFAQYLSDNRDWIEIGIHGFTHQPEEMLRYTQEMVDKMLLATERLYKMLKDEKGINIRVVKGFCAPFWLRNQEVDKALKKRGYWIAINDNVNPEGLPFYKYNWSINEKFPTHLKIVRGHGHVQDVCGNGLVESFTSILDMPTDVEFKFASEVLQ